MSQNNPLVLVGFYQNFHHHASKVLNMSSVFRTKNLQDTGIDNVFFLETPVEKCTRYFPGATSTEEK
jgi:hypothetical protein